MTSLQGCDTSNNNHGRRARFDFHAVADAGLSFVYLKATEGTFFVDSYYTQDSNDAAGQGLHTGGYHFARPERSAAAVEAAFFNQHKGSPGSTWLDLESGLPQYPPASLAAWVEVFMADTDCTGIYWSQSYRDALLPYLEIPRPWLQWVAAPSVDTWPQGAWVWQYGQGAVPGIGVVDLNRSVVLQ